MGTFAKILMPVEWLLVAFGLLTCALYRFFELEMPGQPGHQGASGGVLFFYLKQFLVCLDLYAIILCLYLVARIAGFMRLHWGGLRAAPWRKFFAGISNRFLFGQLFQDVRFFHALLLMFVEFALLKHLIPHVNSELYDQHFIAFDRAVCGGITCAERLASSLGGGIVEVVGKHYTAYYPYMSITAFIFIAAAPRRIAQEFLCAFVALFLVGILWIYAVPTLGPVYALPESFSYMQGSAVGELQQALWNMREVLRANPRSAEAVYMISGFPSLHVAVAVLGSIYLRAIHPGLAVLSWIFVLLIAHSTLYLGWHYLLDDIGSLALVAVSISLARRFSWRWWGGQDFE